MRAEFYKMDFRAWNIGTVDLTIEQEGAYLRLCHAMYDAHGPVPNSTRLLCSLFRCGNVKASALLRALIKAGKIQITADGLLSNRRVASELEERAELSAKRSVIGETGGRARRQGLREPSETQVKPEWMSSDSGVSAECHPTESEVNGSNSLKNNEPNEAIASTLRGRVDKRREGTPQSPPKGAEPDRFPEFRAAYPKRSTAFPTTPARKRWLEAIRRGADPADIVRGAKAYASEQLRIGHIGTQYVKTADAWLHQGRWSDHTPVEAIATPQAAPIPDEMWRDRVQTWRDRGGYWPWRGPPPDEPGTLVPVAVLAEFGLTKHQVAG